MDKYASLREKLEESTSFPSVYIFKFIVPSDAEKIEAVKQLFHSSAKISERKSGKGNYISITGEEYVTSVDAIIEKYKSSEKIQGLIAL